MAHVAGGEGTNAKVEVLLSGGIPKDAKPGYLSGTQFIPIETPEEYEKFFETLNQLEEIKDLYKEAYPASGYYYKINPSKLGSRSEWGSSQFAEFGGKNSKEWKDFISANNKLRGVKMPPLSTLFFDDSLLSFLYQMGRGSYDGIHKRSKVDIDGFLSNLREENKKKRKGIDERYGEDGKKPGAGDGTPVWDSEKYWDFVRYVKANISEAYKETLDMLKTTPDPEMRYDAREHFYDVARYYLGMVYGSATPFGRDVPIDRRNSYIDKLTENKVLPKETINSYKANRKHNKFN